MKEYRDSAERFDDFEQRIASLEKQIEPSSQHRQELRIWGRVMDAIVILAFGCGAIGWSCNHETVQGQVESARLKAESDSLKNCREENERPKLNR